MIKYYFVIPSGQIYINLPVSISRETLAKIKVDVGADKVYYVVCDDVKLFLDL